MNITVRIDPELWDRFGDLTADRSSVIRDFIRWYVRDLRYMPQRPEGTR
jgi:metal-responsive CopG/Arc/MetJ family transcriptional regulator